MAHVGTYPRGRRKTKRYHRSVRDPFCAPLCRAQSSWNIGQRIPSPKSRLGTLAVNFVSTPDLSHVPNAYLNYYMERTSPVERAKRLRHSRVMSHSVPVGLDQNNSDSDSEWSEWKARSLSALPGSGGRGVLSHDEFPFHWTYAMEMYFAMYALGYVGVWEPVAIITALATRLCFVDYVYKLMFILGKPIFVN